MCRRKQCWGCLNFALSKNCDFCCKKFRPPSPILSTSLSPLRLKLASEFPSVAPPNNVSIPIYCLHLNPTTLVDTRRDAILVNVTDSSNYMNSRRQIWIIAINILNGEQIFSLSTKYQNPNPPTFIELRFNFCQDSCCWIYPIGPIFAPRFCVTISAGGCFLPNFTD